MLVGKKASLPTGIGLSVRPQTSKRHIGVKSVVGHSSRDGTHAGSKQGSVLEQVSGLVPDVKV